MTIGQYNNVMNITEMVIDNLDEKALGEIFSGYGGDIDDLLLDIIEETNLVVNHQKAKISSNATHNLTNLTNVFEETLRCENFNYFKASVLDNFKMGFHNLEWGQLAQMYKFLCIIASRDIGKSFEFSYAYPAWRMYKFNPLRYGKSSSKNIKYTNLNKKGILLTNDYSLGKTLLGILRDNIESNEILRERLKPDTREGWGKEGLLAKNGSQIVIKSYQSNLRGYHPGWFVVDDYLTDSNIYSQDQREKYINWFYSVVMNALTNGGNIVVIGTPFSDLDLYSDLKKKGKFKVFEYPAIFPDGSLLAPHRYNFDDLMEKKKILGSIIFSREILVKPVTAGSTIFPYSMIKNSIRGMEKYNYVKSIGQFPEKFEKISIGVDIARSANVGADYFVATTIGKDFSGIYWILNITRKKGVSYNEQRKIIKKLNLDFKPDIIAIESNQMQTFLVDGVSDDGLPAEGFPTTTNKYDLKTGLPGLSIVFERGKFKFPYGNDISKNITDAALIEFSSITWTDKGKLEGVGAHDDIVMSIWKAVKGLNYQSGNFSSFWL